jgi:hypothetical protein
MGPSKKTGIFLPNFLFKKFDIGKNWHCKNTSEIKWEFAIFISEK